MLVKIHKSYRDIVAVCDSELLGKKFEQGPAILDITEFYNGKGISEQELVALLKDYASEDATFNIVGEKSTNAAIKAGIVSKQGIKTIQGVPFALVLL